MDKIGKYEIIKELGSGATSTVYLALDPFSNQQVAIKRFNVNAQQDANLAKAQRRLMMTEASLAGTLSHPHIVKIFDAVLDGAEDYLVMEYVEGETLERHAEIDHLLPLNTVAEIIYKCCKALEYAQHQGVIHRDIKPANILLCGQYDIKISDFGSALLTSRQTTQISGVGSPAYMSPEQIQEKALTCQTDIYSLGVTMYKMLAGKLPFDAGNNYSLIYQIMNIEPPPVSAYRPETPPELDAIVQRAMQKDLSQRYQTWDEFAQDLVNFFSRNVADHAEKIFDTEKFEALSSLGFFRNFSDVELWEVLRLSQWRKAQQDERIISEGEEGHSFFILASGTVKVLKQGRLLSVLHKGDCFGEMAHLSEHESTRSTDVVAKTETTLIEICPDVLEKSSTGCRYQFDRSFLRMLAKRLTVSNTRISYLLNDQENAGGIN
ncbi:MAG: protein kinase [Nitrosomonadales bacterium]|nr:protein kinase [Nitrosomonadales bacterium]